jgi:hypothetical protein
LVVEVKTTDAYRVSLDTFAGYRAKLIEQGTITDKSSILLVVGRQETGELEAQIRGSRHAWDIRLIGIDSLLKLADLKQATDEPDTVVQIRAILAPFEYTKLDRLVDVMFAAAKDVSSVPEASGEADSEEKVLPPTEKLKGFEFTDPSMLEAKRVEIVAGFAAHKGMPLIRKSRAIYWNPTHNLRTVCTISKRYAGKGKAPYWYAFHPKWKRFFEEGGDAYFILGCMDLAHAFALPSRVLFDHLDEMNVTENEDRFYWHIKLVDGPKGSVSLQLPRSGDDLDLTPYRFVASKASAPE